MKLLIIALLTLMVNFAQATETVRLVIPSAPGGISDRLGRVIIKHLGSEPYQFVLDFKPGAGQLIASNLVASTKTGTVAYLAALPIVTAPLLSRNANYDLDKDFIMVSYLGAEPFLLAVRSDLGVSTLSEFLALSKTQDLPYATTGNGTSNHLIGSVIAGSNSRMFPVPYQGSAAGLNALLAGDVKLMIDGEFILNSQIASGKLTVIAVAGTNKRLKKYPQVPTLKESGATDRGIARWLAVVTNSTADPEIIRHMRSRLSTEEFIAELTELGLVEQSAVKDFGSFLRSESLKINSVIRDYKIKIE